MLATFNQKSDAVEKLAATHEAPAEAPDVAHPSLSQFNVACFGPHLHHSRCAVRHVITIERPPTLAEAG